MIHNYGLNFKRGVKTAYDTIYKNYIALLYGYGLKLGADREVVKDSIQNLFVELWDTKHKLGVVKSIKAYLFKSIRRKLASETIKRNSIVHIEAFEEVGISTTTSVEHSLIEKQNFDEQRQRLNEGMAKLTDRQKEIIYLKYYARLSYLEISEIMSLSNKGSYKLMGRAITFLRKQILNRHLLF